LRPRDLIRTRRAWDDLLRLRRQAPERFRLALSEIRVLSRSPDADGVDRRPAPYPYRAGVFLARRDDLLIVYEFTETQLVLVRVIDTLDLYPDEPG
jgi:hypothetical protein